jgi:hypothetical protein
MILKSDKKRCVFTKKAPKPFASILNTTLCDKRLSYRSRGILASLLSKPDNWQVFLQDVVDNGTEGVDSVRACFRELKALGYAKLIRFSVGGSRWIICEDPEAEMGKNDISGEGIFPEVGQNGLITNKRKEGESKKTRNARKKPREAGGLDFVVNKPDFAVRIRAIFHRRESTGFSPKEVKAYEMIQSKITEEDLAMVERCYKRQWPPTREKNMLRHDLFTFLNNYETEVDRARAYCEKHPAPGSKKPKVEAKIPDEPPAPLPDMNDPSTIKFVEDYERHQKRLPAGWVREISPEVPEGKLVFKGQEAA